MLIFHLWAIPFYDLSHGVLTDGQIMRDPAVAAAFSSEGHDLRCYGANLSDLERSPV